MDLLSPVVYRLAFNQRKELFPATRRSSPLKGDLLIEEGLAWLANPNRLVLGRGSGLGRNAWTVVLGAFDLVLLTRALLSAVMVRFRSAAVLRERARRGRQTQRSTL